MGRLVTITLVVMMIVIVMVIMMATYIETASVM